LCRRRRGIEVFDEDGFVADFVVDEFVDCAAGEKKAVASGAHTFLLALPDLWAVGIVGGICGGGVTERFLAEAGAGGRVRERPSPVLCGWR